MTIYELFAIAIALSMDAFAASICKGLALKKMNWKNAIIVGLYFGGFQALMPLIGFFLGIQFKNLIVSIDHWIAFGLLTFIGVSMILEAIKDEDTCNDSITFKTMITLAIATSIDALTVGITFAFLNVNILLAVLLIGITTFTFSVFGVKLGNVFGDKFKAKAEIIGGIVLILIGLKILLEHLEILIL